MTFEEMVGAAKVADPTLTDEQAAEVVNDPTRLTELALEQYFK